MIWHQLETQKKLKGAVKGAVLHKILHFDCRRGPFWATFSGLLREKAVGNVFQTIRFPLTPSRQASMPYSQFENKCVEHLQEASWLDLYSFCTSLFASITCVTSTLYQVSTSLADAYGEAQAHDMTWRQINKL